MTTHNIKELFDNTVKNIKATYPNVLLTHARLDAFFKLWSSRYSLFSDEDSKNLVKCLTTYELGQVLYSTKYLEILPYLKNPTPEVVKIILKRKPNCATLSNLEPIKNFKSRRLVLNAVPGYVWYITPPASEHELFVAVMNKPTIMNCQVFRIDNLGIDLQVKYLGLAQYLLLNKPEDLLPILQHYQRKYANVLAQSRYWIPYWQHVLTNGQ